MAAIDSNEVPLLDRFVPEMQNYLLIENIGGFLIAGGLLSGDEYLVLTKSTSKREAVVDLLQKVKRKGPDSLNIFLHALERCCNEITPSHQGHEELLRMFREAQGKVNTKGTHLQRRKSKSSSLLNWAKKKTKSHKASVVTNVFSSDEEKDGSPQDSSQQSQDSYAADLPVGPQVNKTHEKELEIVQLRQEKEQLQIDLKAKTEEVEQQKVKIKEQSQCIKDLKSQEEACTKEHQTLAKQDLERSDKIVKHEAKIKDLENEISCLQLQVEKALKENKSLTSIAMVPTRDHGPRISRSTSCRSQRLHSLTKIEELKSEITKKDTAMRDTLNQIAQITKDMRDPSTRMGKKWKSDMRLEYHHSDSSFVHSQV